MATKSEIPKPTPTTARTSWAHLRENLMEDTDRTIYKDQFDELGVTSIEGLSLLEDQDFIDTHFNRLLTRTLTTTSMFWKDATTEEKMKFLQLSSTAEWVHFCCEWKDAKLTHDADAKDINRAIENFGKGVRRDISSYPTLKDSKNWRSWLEAVRTTAHTQQIDEVFDPDYTPNNEKDKQLFNLKQSFGFSVLKAKVQTLSGKTIVRKFEIAHDCQGAIRELINSREHGLTGTLNLEEAEDKIKELKLENKYNKPLESFLSYFEQLVMDVDALRDGVKVSDVDKIRWLRDTIRSHTEMYGAIQAYDMQKDTLENNGLTVVYTFDNLYTYLKTYATKFDKEAEKKRKNPR